MIKRSASTAQPTYPRAVSIRETRQQVAIPPAEDGIPYVPLDPIHPLTLSHNPIRIPQPSYALDKILDERRNEYVPVDYDEDDLEIFSYIPPAVAPSHVPSPSPAKAERPPDDWTHDRAWVEECIEHLIPPPTESSVPATNALQRELKAMLKEQAAARSLTELGWYLPEDLMGDNLYQWIVELHSFDKDLPVARDMSARCVLLPFGCL